MEKPKTLSLAGSVVFFFDVFLALLIIFGASFLMQSDFGKVAIGFGFTMLILTFILRIVRKW